MRSDAVRARAVQTARHWLSVGPVFLDSETTGLRETDEICEVAVVDVDGSALFDGLVKPTIHIPAAVTDIHGITDADVAGVPAFSEVWPDLAMLLRGRHVVIYNVEYDTRMMFQSASACCMAAFDLPFNPHCAMDLYAQFYGEWDERHLSYAWQTLANAARQCGIRPCGRLHRARADAELARQIVLHMAEAG